ncbi:unnamed protein product [Protopolystoma xenopodis]|uniref:Uncharacterized protein n=1 Tax=Protopolystoma xenopodis TaxID=117903 RepID=A0A448WPE1_9PLAT|nr:unnamed protein product [Protopolystoma xenopodis]
MTYYRDPAATTLLSLLPFRVKVLREEIQRSVLPEDEGGFLLISCRLAVSEAISFDSEKKVLSFRRMTDRRKLCTFSSESRERVLRRHLKESDSICLLGLLTLVQHVRVSSSARPDMSDYATPVMPFIGGLNVNDPKLKGKIEPDSLIALVFTEMSPSSDDVPRMMDESSTNFHSNRGRRSRGLRQLERRIKAKRLKYNAI